MPNYHNTYASLSESKILTVKLFALLLNPFFKEEKMKGFANTVKSIESEHLGNSKEGLILYTIILFSKRLWLLKLCP